MNELTRKMGLTLNQQAWNARLDVWAGDGCYVVGWLGWSVGIKSLLQYYRFWNILISKIFDSKHGLQNCLRALDKSNEHFEFLKFGNWSLITEVENINKQWLSQKVSTPTLKPLMFGKENLFKKMDFNSKNVKNIESSKITAKVLHKLLFKS